MKRTPLKKNGHLKRITGGLIRNPFRRKPPQEDADTKWRREHLAKYKVCMIGHVLCQEGIKNSCQIVPTGLHERIKRGQGGPMVDPRNLLPSCWWCNQWVEREAIKADELGVLVRPWKNVHDIPVKHLTFKAKDGMVWE